MCHENGIKRGTLKQHVVGNTIAKNDVHDLVGMTG